MQPLSPLAWWLFTREDSRAETTEPELRSKAAEFLLGRGYESEEEARAAAQEFIEFCRGRMWVFSEVGTNANGDKLYAFTHRTFMEYFAATHLAATSDTPEHLALALAPHAAEPEWMAVGALAIQIKQSGTDWAVDRIYTALLDQPEDPKHSYDTLIFLMICVYSVRPSPATIRRLTRVILDHAFGYEFRRAQLLHDLISFPSPRYASLVFDESAKRIAAMVDSRHADGQAMGLRLVLKMAGWFHDSPHRSWVDQQASRYGAEMLAEAARDRGFRIWAVSREVISVEQALTMPGGLSVLLGDQGLVAEYQAKLTADEDILLQGLAAIGRFLAEHPQLPWVRAPLYDDPLPLITMQMTSMLDKFGTADEFTGLGLGAAIAIGSELSDMPTFRHAYRLSELPMPAQFRELFRNWAAGRVTFAEITNG